MHPKQKENIRADLNSALSLIRPFDGPLPPVGLTKRAYSGPGYRFYLDEQCEEVLARTLRTLLVDCGWSVKFSESHARELLVDLLKEALKTGAKEVAPEKLDSLLLAHENYSIENTVYVPLHGI